MTSRQRQCHKCKAYLSRSAFSRLCDGSKRFYTWCDECREDRTRPRVYVVLLDDAVGARRNASHPSVYVGQSVLPPEERFTQHKAGIKKGKGFVSKFGVRLMPRLFRNTPTFDRRQGAEAEEARLAKRLERKGYTVYGGH